MIDFGKWALDNRKLVYFIIFVLCVGGIWGCYQMSKLEDPRITVKQALVVAVYPGASAYQTELEVTDPLEKSIRSMKGVEEVQSTSMNDMAIIQVSIDRTIPADEIEQYFDMLRRKVGDTSLPSGVSVKVMDTFGDVYGMFYAITSDGYRSNELGDYAELIKREIKSIKGVSEVQLYGKRTECINVYVKQDKLASLGVLPAEVISTLNGQNQTSYAGYYDAEGSRIRVEVGDRYNTVDDIKNLIIQGHEDDQLRLRDIADVEENYVTPIRNQFFYDGQRSIGMSISASQGTDIVKLGAKVDKRLQQLEASRLPAGIGVEKVFNQPERVVSALSTFALNLVESVAIVIVLLMLTMGYRNGVIIGKVLIITVLGSFLLLFLMNGTLQRVSLATFILAMGMLVDNAIVIADGIQVDMMRGLPKQQALTAIGRKTAWPLLGATLIAIIAFLPPFMSPDTAGEYIRDLFIVLAVSLMLSWFLALIYVPITESKHAPKQQVAKSSDELYGGKYYDALRKVLGWCLRNRWVPLTGGAVLVLVSVYCFKFLPREFFPDMEYNQIFIEYKLPEGSTQRQVQHDLDDITKWLKKNPEVTNIAMSLGGTPSRYNLVRSIATPSMAYGELIVDFTSPKALVKDLEGIQQYLIDNYPEAATRAKRYNLMYKKYPIELQFSGSDPAVLKSLAARATAVMRSDSLTRFVNNDWEPVAPVLSVAYNQAKARTAGVSRGDVALSLLAATEGIPVGEFYEGIYDKPIYVKCVGKDGKPVEMLSKTPLFSLVPPIQNLSASTVTSLLSGATSEQEIMEDVFRTVPMSQASDGVEIKWEDPVVVRDNGVRAITVRCEPVGGVSAEQARQSLEDGISKIEMPEGYSVKWRGEYEASNDSSMSLFGGVPLALILIVGILIALFRDYKKPSIILLCIPLLAVGVVFGMLVSGKAFGFVAICGCLGLMGMLIKNGVILVDEIDLELASGMEPAKALIESSASRFRPVMMASLTTILGMVPLLSDCLFGALAVTIMAGLFVGTLITLLFIPVMYSLFFRIKISK